MANDQLGTRTNGPFNLTPVKLGVVADLSSGVTFGDAALGGSAPDLNQGSTLTITTDGTYDFGTRPQADPLLYIQGDDVYENGVSNNYHANLADGSVVDKTSVDANSIWAQANDVPSPLDDWAEAEDYQVKIDKTAEKQRHSHVDSFYRAGGQGRVGWPLAYGGDTSVPDTTGGPYFYWRWFEKSKAPLYFPRFFNYTSLSGTFDTQTDSDGFEIPGESVTIEETDGTTFSGYIIFVDTINSRINFVADGDTGLVGMDGGTVTGDVSGAVCTVSTPPADTFVTSGKHFRIWDMDRLFTYQDGGSTDLFDLDDIDQNPIKEYNDGGLYPVFDNYDQWQLHELEIDLTQPTAHYTYKINHQVHRTSPAEGLDISGHTDPDRSITIAALGMDNNHWAHQSIYHGEDYFDNQPSRVLISTVSDIENATGTNSEIQRPTSWAPTQAGVVLNLGALDGQSPLYLLVKTQAGTWLPGVQLT